MPAILIRLFILFINYILRVFDKAKILLYKLFVRYLVVKLACVNAALVYIRNEQNPGSKSEWNDVFFPKLECVFC